MTTSLYFAYGSNLHPGRLGERVPSCRLLGTAVVRQAAVSYIKRGKDGSGKCSLEFTGCPGDVVLGAVYQIRTVEKPLLDEAEGLGEGYDETSLRLLLGSDACDVFTYVAPRRHQAPGLRPYDWYKALVVAGARYHQFPHRYVARLDGVECTPDPDAVRRRRHHELLARGEVYRLHDPTALLLRLDQYEGCRWACEVPPGSAV